MPKDTIAEETVHLVAAKTCLTCGREFEADSENSVCPDDQTLLCPSVSDSDIGMSVGSFELVSKIGEGSSGQVYIAAHRVTGTKVAAKLLKLNLLSDPAAVRRFQQEAQAISSLVHPNITSIHEFGVLPDGRPFIVMDYAGPTTLSDLLSKQGPIKSDQANVIFLQIVDALRAAHHAGILHRDIKPSNIIIDEQNNVKVIDFGIAKINGIETTVTMTRTGATVGTPAYMSPEQCLGGKLDPRSDIYSLGCLMYECLSGKKVFPSDNAFLCMNQHSFEPAPQLSKFVKSLPQFLLSAVMICLHKSPDHRFQSMSELQSVLQAVSDRQSKTQFAARSTLFKSRLRSLRPARTKNGELAGRPATESKKQTTIAVFALVVVLVYFVEQFTTRPEVPTFIPPPSQIKSVISETKTETNENQTDNPDVASLMKQFADIRGEIEQLEKEKQASAAQTMNKELLRYQSLFNDQITPPASHGNEVHSIAVRKGYGGIGSYRDGKGLPGTTSVNVTYTGNPVILTLLAEQPVDWQIKTAAGVKLKQVILTGPEPKSANLPQPGIKLTVNPTDHIDPADQLNNQVFVPYAAKFGDRDFERVNEIANRQVSGDLVSAQNSESSREQLVVGAESVSWRAQYVMWRMHDFYETCMHRKQAMFQADLKNLKFDGASISGESFNPTRWIGTFNPYGPTESKFKKIDKMGFFSAVSVTRPGGKKAWYLLGDGRDDPEAVLAKYDPDKNKLTTLIKPNDAGAPVWHSYRGITYDSKREALIVLAPQGDVPFLKYDLGTGKLSNFGMPLPYGREIYGACYSRENDSIYALAANLLENPYHMYLYQIRDGRLVKSTKLSKDFYDVQSLSMCKVQLHAIGSYVIAVVSNGIEAPSPDGMTVGSTCGVIERSTGKVVFSGVMAPKSGGK